MRASNSAWSEGEVEEGPRRDWWCWACWRAVVRRCVRAAVERAGGVGVTALMDGECSDRRSMDLSEEMGMI